MKSYLPIFASNPYLWLKTSLWANLSVLQDIIEGDKSKIYDKLYILSTENDTKFIYYVTLNTEKNFHSAMLSMEF